MNSSTRATTRASHNYLNFSKKPRQDETESQIRFEMGGEAHVMTHYQDPPMKATVWAESEGANSRENFDDHGNCGGSQLKLFGHSRRSDDHWTY
jgi:hypothetical protein